MTESPGNPNNNAQQAIDSPGDEGFENIPNSPSSGSFVHITSPSLDDMVSPMLTANDNQAGDDHLLQPNNDSINNNNMMTDDQKSPGNFGANDVDADADTHADTPVEGGGEGGQASQKTSARAFAKAAFTGVNDSKSGDNEQGDSTMEEANSNTDAAPQADAMDNEYAILSQGEMQELNNKLRNTVRTAPLKINDTWYIIIQSWYDRWRTNMYTPEEVGPIQNESLLLPDTDFLKPGLVENQHFTVVPQSVWDVLSKIYKCPTVIPRKVIINIVTLTIDYKFPQKLRFFKSSASDKIIDHYVSKNETIGKVKDRVCKLLEVEPPNIRMWDYYNNSKYAELKNPEYVSNSRLVDDQLILLDERLADGTWPPEKTQTYGYYSRFHQRQGPARPGITGLDNLGNTCFMNSSLQCLSNTTPLTRYLLNDKHIADLNKDNPLGCHGDLAVEYANLIKQVWRGDLSSAGPRSFKQQIERFAPQFMGYHQHDSQELLAFLLDGLHEDMNKVKKKPFIEGKDYDGRPDEAIAKEQWEMHRARNDSIIVDWFQSQLKSRLVCPVCDKVSITFDPFMYLSLPLPVNVRKMFQVVFVPYDSTKLPSVHNIEMSKTGVFEEMIDLVSKNVEVEASRIVATNHHMSQIIKIYKPTQSVEIVSNRDTIVLYEINGKEGYHNFKVTMRTSPYSNHFPFILSLSKAPETIDDLYWHILERLQNLIKLPDKVKEIFDNNQKPVPPQENPENDEYDSYRNKYMDSYSMYAMRRKPRVKDPRFIFQMVPESQKIEQKDFNFDPINFDAITVTWEDEEFETYFDAEKLQNAIPSMVFHKDVSTEKELTLNQCLDLFTTVEQLGPEDPWYCSNCKEHQRATKKFDIWSAPPILVIHLKRFSYKKAWREKLDTVVNFPLKGLDLSPYVLNKSQADPIYDLFAVSNHYGSMGGGHYTAYALNEIEDQWFKFDDSSTHSIDPSNIVTDAAYVLFYRRRDTFSPDFALNAGLKSFKETVTDLVATNPPATDNSNSSSSGSTSDHSWNNSYYNSSSSSSYGNNYSGGGSGMGSGSSGNYNSSSSSMNRGPSTTRSTFSSAGAPPYTRFAAAESTSDSNGATGASGPIVPYLPDATTTSSTSTTTTTTAAQSVGASNTGASSTTTTATANAAATTIINSDLDDPAENKYMNVE
ncbi:hypothetical protein SAMD00019534_015850 [Acytostelium subglobosum LB1]|uniref:hypothetical protein n=1 Tax=Acytostelium subglobosum LB1 TaxID=1410327 RepID=UPI0006448178|nr:hypothetical protein SAMD00019534_015850 [Acytostelium subglobosum LB1]GAM18410.1 hypothetical protein SAMD00019534_015850 [Acytostelium subglobosum LB1]|eukprot:XP_012757630.1 hypothetical protein SAMD00019534_015850 [Acytostelium subglobosum LB1]